MYLRTAMKTQAIAYGCDVFFYIFELICLKHEIYGQKFRKLKKFNFKSIKYPNTSIKVISSFYFKYLVSVFSNKS